MVYYTVAKICQHNFKHNGLILEHNREDFWEIPESIMGKISNIIDAGLNISYQNQLFPYFL